MVAGKDGADVKNRRTIGAFVSVCCLLLLGGCYEPLAITDAEMDMVAEYAAGVLVEHGTKTTEKLLDREEQEVAKQLSATPTPRPTIAPAKPTAVPDEGGAGDTASPTKSPTPAPTEVPENTELTMQDLTELLDRDGFFFSYTGYQTTALYQGAGDLFAAADEGKQLVVLEFEVTNESADAAVLEMNKGAAKDFVYTLRMGTTSVKPSLTLLQEDLYTSYQMEYAAGETKKGVLVFECSKEANMDSLLLTILSETAGKEDSVLIKIK
ncbi:MAG: hypothetical protein IJW37_08830 [Lachnospiraceae bacterium]|nr:hypothetical protein [Lachnospiraceae bacterium]